MCRLLRLSSGWGAAALLPGINGMCRHDVVGRRAVVWLAMLGRGVRNRGAVGRVSAFGGFAGLEREHTVQVGFKVVQQVLLVVDALSELVV